MELKEQLKKILSRCNPLAVRRRNTMRRALTNQTPSLLCPNCIGGILFHDLGLQFRSPTVNLMMFQRDFVKFVRNMDYYLSQELRFFNHPEHEFPCARLDDLTIHFTHYHSEQEASEKWYARAQRLDRDNLFVFLTERDGLTREEILSLGELKVRGLVVFTANEYPDIPYALHIPHYATDGEIGNILKKSLWDESREYERVFNFVKWFNEADGAPFDAARFAK